MRESLQFFLNKKNLINLTILLILAAGLPIAINLARQQQILRSRAATPAIEIIDGDCVEQRNGKKVLICNEVPLKLISPIGGVKGSTSRFSPRPTLKPSSSATQVPTACQSSLKTVDGKPIVNVRNFGNDSSAIQKALDCFKDPNSGGGAVFIPAGSYTITKKITTYSNVTVFGDGMDKTIITTSSTSDGGMSNDSSKGQANITIRGLTLKGPGNKGGNCCYGLKLENLSHGFVIDVASDNWGMDGIYLGYKLKDGLLKGVNNVRVSACRTNNNDRNGISLTHGSSNVIDNCNLENNNADPSKRASAIDLEPDSGAETSNNLILNNQLLRNKGNGIGLGPNPNEPPPAGKLSNNVVCSNNASDNDFAGIVDYPGTIYFRNTGNDPRPKDNGSTSACDIPSDLIYLQEGPPKPTVLNINNPQGALLSSTWSFPKRVLAQDPGCEEGQDCGSDEGDDPTGAESGGGECTSDEKCSEKLGETGYCDKHNSPDGTGVCRSGGSSSDSGGRESGNGSSGGGNKSKQDKKNKNKSTPMPTIQPPPTQTQTNQPTPSALNSPQPAPLLTYTVYFKLAESESLLRDVEQIEYNEEPVIFNYILEDEKPGLKQIWVEFKNSENRIFRKNVFIELAEEDPEIEEISCKLDIQEEGVVFDINGKRFGPRGEDAKIFSDFENVTTLDWSENQVTAILEKPDLAKTGDERFNLKLTRADGQESDTIPCAIGVTQVALGTDLFCREKGAQEEGGVEVTFVDTEGKRLSEAVSIDKDGVIVGLKSKLQVGKRYLVSVKTQNGLRRNAIFTASSGTAVARSSLEDNFLIPIGDIYTPGGGDGAINSADRLELTKQWIVTKNPDLSGDFNKDSRVNSLDWACMRHGFGLTDESLPQVAPVEEP